MSKERNITDEKFLEVLIALREEKISKYDLIKKEINIDKSGALGVFPYTVKETGEKIEGELFLISEIHDGYEYDAVYNKQADVVAYHDYSSNEGLKAAKEFELDTQRLERQILEARQRNKDCNASNSNGATNAGNGRDLADKEHEKEEPKKAKEEQKDVKNHNDSDKKQLRNLKDDISMDNRTRIRLNTVVNGHCLWEVLGIEERLKDRLPKGVSEKAFRDGYLTRIDAKELEEIERARGEEAKIRDAEDVFAVVSPSGDIIELDEEVLEPQKLGTNEERLEQEQKRERWADGEHTGKPQTDMTLTQTSKWRIKNIDSRFAVNEEWFLAVDYNEKYVKNGTEPVAPKYLKEISIVQTPRFPERVYNRDSAEARTLPTTEYKLEDNSEATPTSKEQKQIDQVTKKDANEAKNILQRHHTDIERIVDNLTAKYGEENRKEIEEKVDKEHKKGRDVEEIEKNVKDEMDEEAQEEFIHGRRREM